MKISEFDYELPEYLIAQEPLDPRDASRMLVVDRATGRWSDSSFDQFALHVHPSDIVVINNTKVIPARLVGQRKETGGRIEIFLVRELEANVWEALIRPGNRLRTGSLVVFPDPRLTAEIMNQPGNELRQVRFHCRESFENLLSEIGSTPLPPYIKRPTGASAEDSERYQTVYAKQRGAIAAPTAGLHFTPALLSEVASRGRIVEITLHVGYGTFEPVRVEEVDEHKVGAERFEIGEKAARQINEAKKEGGRIIVVGTTTLRALESSTTAAGEVLAGTSETALTIKPGYRFRIADALLTNFHLPRSSLLLLVCSFAGRELILNSYAHAVKHRYRFYSYGDCMLIL